MGYINGSRIVGAYGKKIEVYSKLDKYIVD